MRHDGSYRLEKQERVSSSAGGGNDGTETQI